MTAQHVGWTFYTKLDEHITQHTEVELMPVNGAVLKPVRMATVA